MMHDTNEVLVDRWSWVIPAPLITLTLEDMHSLFNWHYDIPYYEMRCALNDQIQTATAGWQGGDGYTASRQDAGSACHA